VPISLSYYYPPPPSRTPLGCARGMQCRGAGVDTGSTSLLHFRRLKCNCDGRPFVYTMHFTQNTTTRARQVVPASIPSHYCLAVRQMGGMRFNLYPTVFTVGHMLKSMSSIAVGCCPPTVTTLRRLEFRAQPCDDGWHALQSVSYGVHRRLHTAALTLIAVGCCPTPSVPSHAAPSRREVLC
jgi:hypothetical protein